VGIVEAFLVFSVASFNFPVMAGSIRANPLVADIQKAQGFLKLGQVIGFFGTETIGKFKTIVSLNAFHLDPFSLEFVDNSKQELV
jgi:hypothetical protein